MLLTATLVRSNTKKMERVIDAASRLEDAERELELRLKHLEHEVQVRFPPTEVPR